jgi:hypothetical protein
MALVVGDVLASPMVAAAVQVQMPLAATADDDGSGSGCSCLQTPDQLPSACLRTWPPKRFWIFGSLIGSKEMERQACEQGCSGTAVQDIMPLFVRMLRAPITRQPRGIGLSKSQKAIRNTGPGP